MANRGNGGFTQGNGVIAAAIVIAALILSWGSSGSQPRYQLAASNGAIVRLDTDSGALLACDLRQCRQVEAPARAKTFGPLSVVFGGREAAEERRQAQIPANRQ